MATVQQTFQSVHLPQTQTQQRRAFCKQPLHWLQIELESSQVVSIVSDPIAESMLPAGTTILTSCSLGSNGLPTISRTPGFTSGSSTSPTASYKIHDPEAELQDWLASKSANDLSITNRVFRQYTFCEGDDVASNPDAFLRYTFRIGDHSINDVREVVLKCADIQRNLDVEIFEPHSVRLRQSISGEAILIPTTIPQLDYSFDVL